MFDPDSGGILPRHSECPRDWAPCQRRYGTGIALRTGPASASLRLPARSPGLASSWRVSLSIRRWLMTPCYAYPRLLPTRFFTATRVAREGASPSTSSATTKAMSALRSRIRAAPGSSGRSRKDSRAWDCGSSVSLPVTGESRTRAIAPARSGSKSVRSGPRHRLQHNRFPWHQGADSWRAGLESPFAECEASDHPRIIILERSEMENYCTSCGKWRSLAAFWRCRDCLDRFYDGSRRGGGTERR